MRKRMTAFFSLLVPVLAFTGCHEIEPATSPTNKSTGIWSQVNGLLAIQSMATSGSNLYTASSQGVFLSTDHGNNWKKADSNLSCGALCVTVYNGGILVGRDFNGGLSFSTNAGASWTSRDSGFAAGYGTNHSALCFAVDGPTVYAGTKSGGVFRSRDFGNSWSASNDGMPPPPPVYSLAESGSHILAGTRWGVYISTDGGDHWSLAQQHMPWILSFAVAGVDVYAGTIGDEIYWSADGGESWGRLASTLPRNAESAASVATSEGVLYLGIKAGVYCSTDRGGEWINISDNIADRISAGGVVSIFLVDKYLFVELYDNSIWRRAL